MEISPLRLRAGFIFCRMEQGSCHHSFHAFATYGYEFRLMLNRLDQIQKEALESLKTTEDYEMLRAWKSEYLSKNSPLFQALSGLGELAKAERPVIGKRANEIRRILEDAYSERAEVLRGADVEHSLNAEVMDVTMPGRPVRRGRLHIATQILRQIFSIWTEMGFQIYRSRDV